MLRESETSSKILDVWEYENLLHFFKFRKHKQGLSSKQVRRVINLEKHYLWDNDKIYY